MTAKATATARRRAVPHGRPGRQAVVVKPAAVMPSIVAPLVVSPQQAAEMLSLSRASIYVLMATGDLKSHKLGASRRIAVGSIEKLLRRSADAGSGLAAPKESST